MRSRDSIIAEGEAFLAFYGAEREPLLRYFARRVYDAELALDLCSEVFAQAFLDRRKLRATDIHGARAWLYSIARTRLTDYFRKGDAERKALRRLRIELPAPHADELARVEQLADLDSARVVIRDGLLQLSADHRAALELRVVEERPYEEIAASLGISEQTARSRVSRALGALSESIQLDPTTLEAS